MLAIWKSFLSLLSWSDYERHVFYLSRVQRIGVYVEIFSIDCLRPVRNSAAQKNFTYQTADISKSGQVSFSIKKKEKYGYIAKHNFYELCEFTIVSIWDQQSDYRNNMLNIFFFLFFFLFVFLFIYID